MNWFTKANVSTQPLEKKEALLEEHGGCEHVEKDPSLMTRVSYENDSFGREGYCMCQVCADAADEHDRLEEHTCSDCKGSFPAKDMVEWKWYDFYAAQGDQPLWICNTCRTKERHIQRVKKDRQEYEEEMSYYDRQRL